jgi:ATP-binding cassette subfamily B protein
MMVLRTGQQIDSRLILGYYKHLLKLQRFFDSMRVGEIISRVNDALRIRIFINDVALTLIMYVSP